MPDPTVTEPQVAPPPVSAPEPAAPAPSQTDALSTLAPEVRQSVEPIFKPLQEKLATYEKEIESSKSYQEKATALDRLVQDADFQRYWTARNSRPVPAQTQAPEQAPAMPYTPEEYQSAYDKALQGDLSALTNLQEKQVKAILSREVAPAMDRLNQKTREVELSVELGDLLRDHPDARDLDKNGLLEPFLHYYTDKLGKPMEFSYQQARKAQEALMGALKAQAAKEVQDKRTSITETPGTITSDQGIQYLDTPEQVLRAQINAAVKGERVQYRVKPRK